MFIAWKSLDKLKTWCWSYAFLISIYPDERNYNNGSLISRYSYLYKSISYTERVEYLSIGGKRLLPI